MDYLQQILEQRFGFTSFRPGQREAIIALLTKGRVLCIQPTGHGKSLLYQLPSCLLQGVTLVISPLLALMRDQIDHLNNRFGIPAGAMNSDQSEEENMKVRQALLQGEIQVLFIAPEQMDHVDKFQFLLSLNVKLVVVDEAHCISTWGHDFRPSYRQILHFIQAAYTKNPDIKILGLTATADERVERDIAGQLSFLNGEMAILRETMDRPNIYLSVVNARGIPSKLAICEELLAQLEGCGLIYCATRENSELVAEYLSKKGLSVVAYHAGFDRLDKRRLQQEFITDKYKALATTNALGMGIDKGNLRYIIHFDIPGSITAYYQEVGRCGRDGLQARGILIYDPADRRIQEYFIESAQPKPEDFQTVLSAVKSAETCPNLTEIKRLTGLHPTRVTTVIAELVEQKFLKKLSQSGTQVYQNLSRDDLPSLIRYENQYEVKSRELKHMLGYAEQMQQCRMAFLRRALGDCAVENCGRCDVCLEEGHVPILVGKVDEIYQWLNARPIPISAAALNKVSEGISLLDGKMRLPIFIHFMLHRASPLALHNAEQLSEADSLGMDDELVLLLQKHASTLASTRKIGGVVSIPSRTWYARDKVANFLAYHLQVPVVSDLLSWTELPPKRQGELLNNDQRHYNVHQRMKADESVAIPCGALILLDDYIGSGNTMKEAARALRKTKKITNELIPFTIAAIKWHLGKPGFS